MNICRVFLLLFLAIE